MRVIAVGNEKGGTTKTTVTATLAAGLAQHGHRVVIVDTDPQGHLAKLLGLPKEDGLYNLVADYQEWTDVLRPVPSENFAAPDHLDAQLWLLPAHKLTANLPLVEHVASNFLIFYERLQELAEYGVDYVMIDTSPTATLIDSLIYAAIDDLLIVTIPEELSFDGILETRAKLERFQESRIAFGLAECRVLGIQPNLAIPRTNKHREKLAKLNGLYPGEVWTPVKQRIGWAEASDACRTVFAYAPKAGVTHDAWDMVARFEEALNR